MSGYSISNYGGMIRDRRRTEPFVQALRAAINPGSTLLDIGTGTGIFSFLACQFDAARVYALEPDVSIKVAERIARDIPGSERITWIQDLSTAIDLPEQVDVVIGDLHGALPFYQGNIESLIDARKRHLKPGGRMIPTRDRLYALPACAPEESLRIESPWRSNDYGLDFSAALPYVVNRWWRANSDPAPPEQLLAQAACWGEIDYTTTESPDLDGEADWEIERPGTLHGLYVWFDGDLGDSIGYSNAPHLPEMVYGRAFFPFERPTEVVPGDRVHARLSARVVNGDYVFRWDSRITAADGGTKASFAHSSFKAEVLTADKLRKTRNDYVPALTDEGQFTLATLQGLAEGRNLQELADSMASRFPGRFRTPAQAMLAVAKLSQKYG